MIYRIIKTQCISFVFAKQFPKYGVLVFFIYMNVIICFSMFFRIPSFIIFGLYKTWVITDYRRFLSMIAESTDSFSIPSSTNCSGVFPLSTFERFQARFSVLQNDLLLDLPPGLPRGEHLHISFHQIQ